MSFYKNSFQARGYVNFLKKNTFPSGESYFQFSLALNMGKTKDGESRGSEYMICKVSTNASKSNEGKFNDGWFVEVEGRIRNQKGSDGKTYTYIEAFDLFPLLAPKGDSQQPEAKPKAQPMQPQYSQSQPYQPPPPPQQRYGNAPMQPAPHQQAPYQGQQEQHSSDFIPF